LDAAALSLINDGAAHQRGLGVIGQAEQLGTSPRRFDPEDGALKRTVSEVKDPGEYCI
jgi:hypothetical protein